MKREDLEAREFGLIIASSNFPFYAAPEADAVMDAMEARIKELEADAELDQKKRLMLCEGYNRKCERVKELEAENERLKSELQQSATNCNKLRCLALHAMSEWLSALLWLAGTHLGKCLEPHIDVNLCTALRRKYNDAYRKTKKELREVK